MKKSFALLLILSLLASVCLTGCGETEEIIIEYDEGTLLDYSKFAGTELKVYNWGYYISDGADGSIDVNAEFEKLTGIKVVYDNFDSNEALYTKLKNEAANYDIIIPSDYMIDRLIQENRLQKIDFDNIPNYRYIDEKYKNSDYGLNSYDPNNEYSVPYNVGMVGVIYNTEIVTDTPTSWSLMWDEKYEGKILNFNNPRDAFAIAQFYQGTDINSTNIEDWNNAFDALAEQKSILQSYVMDEVFNKMESGEAAIAPYYAGDFFTMYANNEYLSFYYPEEGTNVFIDALCIPKNAENKEAAELYINFLLDPAIAKANAMYMYYASPNTAVIEDEEYLEFLDELYPVAPGKAYEILYGSADNPKNDSFIDLREEIRDHMSAKWTELGVVATEDNGNTVVYIVCVVIIIFFAAWGIYSALRKKRRSSHYN